jgi:hypothetical protein
MGLLPEWADYLYFYKRFIDDVIGAWLVNPAPVKMRGCGLLFREI